MTTTGDHTYLEAMSVGDVKRLADKLGITTADLVQASLELTGEAKS